MRIVFMGTAEFANPCLELLNREYDVIAVITQPDRPEGRGRKMKPQQMKTYAQSLEIEVFQPEDVNDERFLDILRKKKPDLFITAAFGQMLSEAFLEIPRLGCINVHASLLPKYRGAAPIHWALINGDAQTGITTMFTDKGMDTGDMLLRNEIDIDDEINFERLHDELMVTAPITLKRTLKRLENKTLVRIKQKESQATYAPLKPIREKKICRIDWNKTSEQIHNLIRALDPYPGAFTMYRGKRMKIFRSRYIGCPLGEHTPGKIVAVGSCEMMVATGDGLINIFDIQMQNCRKMCIEECGHNIVEGEILE